MNLISIILYLLTISHTKNSIINTKCLLQLVIAVNNFNLEKADRIKMIENNKALRIETEQKQREIDELSKTIDDYKLVRYYFNINSITT